MHNTYRDSRRFRVIIDLQIGFEFLVVLLRIEVGVDSVQPSEALLRESYVVDVVLHLLQQSVNLQCKRMEEEEEKEYATQHLC